eukprot:284818759_4
MSGSKIEEIKTTTKGVQKMDDINCETNKKAWDYIPGSLPFSYQALLYLLTRASTAIHLPPPLPSAESATCESCGTALLQQPLPPSDTRHTDNKKEYLCCNELLLHPLMLTPGGAQSRDAFNFYGLEFLLGLQHGFERCVSWGRVLEDSEREFKKYTSRFRSQFNCFSSLFCLFSSLISVAYFSPLTKFLRGKGGMVEMVIRRYYSCNNRLTLRLLPLWQAPFPHGAPAGYVPAFPQVAGTSVSSRLAERENTLQESPHQHDKRRFIAAISYPGLNPAPVIPGPGYQRLARSRFALLAEVWPLSRKIRCRPFELPAANFTTINSNILAYLSRCLQSSVLLLEISKTFCNLQPFLLSFPLECLALNLLLMATIFHVDDLRIELLPSRSPADAADLERQLEPRTWRNLFSVCSSSTWRCSWARRSNAQNQHLNLFLRQMSLPFGLANLTPHPAHQEGEAGTRQESLPALTQLILFPAGLLAGPRRTTDRHDPEWILQL